MVEEVMDLDYSNSLFIEMIRPRQSRRIAGACRFSLSGEACTFVVESKPARYDR